MTDSERVKERREKEMRENGERRERNKEEEM